MTRTTASPKRSAKQKNDMTFRRPELVPTRTDFANLSQEEIRQMGREQLIAVIRLADVPLFRERANEHLPGLDRRTLERLAFLAQWKVRNRRN